MLGYECIQKNSQNTNFELIKDCESKTKYVELYQLLETTDSSVTTQTKELIKR